MCRIQVLSEGPREVKQIVNVSKVVFMFEEFNSLYLARLGDVMFL